MSSKGTFSFKNTKFKQIKLTDDIFLRIENAGFAIARVYFVNAQLVEIPIPETFSIVDRTNNGVLVRPIANLQFFVLAWSDNYAVQYRDKDVVGLHNQRQWFLTGGPELGVETFDIE